MVVHSHSHTLSCHLSANFAVYFIMARPSKCFFLFRSSDCQAERFFAFSPTTASSASIFPLLRESDCTKPLESIGLHEPRVLQRLDWTLKVDHVWGRQLEQWCTVHAHQKGNLLKLTMLLHSSIKPLEQKPLCMASPFQVHAHFRTTFTYLEYVNYINHHVDKYIPTCSHSSVDSPGDQKHFPPC